MLFDITFTNGSMTHEHAENETEVREIVAVLYPNKEVEEIKEAEWEEVVDA